MTFKNFVLPALALTTLATFAATPKPRPLPRCRGPHFGIITDAGVMIGRETTADGRTYDCASSARKP